MTAKVSKTVVQLKSASCQQKYSMMVTVPIIVSIPENREASDCEIVVEMFSISFVIRLIISPWEWVSI